MPKEQIFGPMVMGRGGPRASESEAWTRERGSLHFRAWLLGLGALEGCVKWFQKASTARAGRTFPGSLQVAAGSCSQGETQAKEGWRPSCLPSLPQELGPHQPCSLYLSLHCRPLADPGRRYHAWDWPSNRLARLAGDHAPRALETSPRPLSSTRQPAAQPSRNATAPVSSRVSHST